MAVCSLYRRCHDKLSACSVSCVCWPIGVIQSWCRLIADGVMNNDRRRECFAESRFKNAWHACLHKEVMVVVGPSLCTHYGGGGRRGGLALHHALLYRGNGSCTFNAVTNYMGSSCISFIDRLIDRRMGRIWVIYLFIVFFTQQMKTC